MKKMILLILTLITMLIAVEPQRIIINLTEEPETSMAITFRFYEKVESAYVEYIENADDIKMHTRAKTLVLEPDVVYTDTTKSVAHYVCSVILKDLKPGTEYAYRVGDHRDESPWYVFKTAKDEALNYSIVYLGDPQWGYETYLPRLYDKALKTAPDAAFWYVAGDMVDYPYENWQWDAYFKGGKTIFATYPHIMAVGNHEYLWAYRDHRSELPETICPHFNHPENGPEGLEETCYYLDYRGVRYVVLNGNERWEDQARWLEDILKDNENTWTIVGIHQGFYPCGWERDYPRMRELFIPLFEKYGVNMVLQGHDHSYTRTFPLKEGKIVKKPSQGVNYVISVAGAKMYPFKSKFDHLYAKKGKEGVQYFQTLEFKKKRLIYKSYTASGELHDQLIIKK